MRPMLRLLRRLAVGVGLAATAFLACSAPPPLSWESAPGCRWRSVSVPPGGKPGFTFMPPETTGVTFSNDLAEATTALNRILENGSGVALGDIDGDGWCDLYFCRLEGPNVLYRNLGDWKFEDITATAGVACPNQYSTGAVLADIDGDGDLDLLVNAIGGGTRCFFNDGHGRFTELTGSRLVRRFGSTSLALADIDGDGDLDLYVTNYRTTTYRDRPPGLKLEASMVDGKIVVTPADRFIPVMPRAGGVEVLEKGDRDFLYLNDGQGRFLPVSWTAGSFLDEQGQPLKEPPTDWGLSVMFRDLNGDRHPDIYVCNDFFYFRDRVWLNEGGRRFRAIASTALRKMSVSSMSVDFADLNRDGWDDFFVSDMISRLHAWRHRQRPQMMQGLVAQAIGDPEFRPEVAHNTLFLNRGDGSYAEIAQLSGVDASEWSWGTVFLDVDLDGYEDLIVPTGNLHDVQDADALEYQSRVQEEDTLANRVKKWRLLPPLETPILAFHNNHDLTFTEAGTHWGFTQLGPFQGIALADLDNDGDLDLVCNRLNGVAGLYRNDATTPRVAVRLAGAGLNTRGVGAKITVLGGPVTQTQEMQCGGRYLSSDDNLRVFAAAEPDAKLRIEVAWRAGKRTVIADARPNRVYEIQESAAQPEASAPAAPPATRALFEDVSPLLAHRHQDAPFDDFARQPLLSRKLSQLGPGVAWCDLDGDGWDDLVIGTGRGGQLAAFRNDGRGHFSAFTNACFAQAAERDLTTVLSWPAATGRMAVLAGCANYEDGATNAPAVRLYDLAGGTPADLVPGGLSSVGPLAVADIDGDGDLDLFVGGRVVPGRYPEAAASSLYRNQGGHLVQDAENSALWSQAGLVSAAVFSDLDADGWPELILACEWGPVRVYANAQGRFSEATGRLGLEACTGWWNGVATGDVDGDGQLDIIAANWGRNTRFQRYLAQPLKVFYGDFDGTSTIHVLETYFEPGLRQWAPWREYRTVSGSLPFILEHTPTFKAYGLAGIDELLGDRRPKARELEARTLDSMVFLNRGGKFVAKPLPVETQFAPAFGVCVADFDGDGREDVFLSQNFFGVEPETSRYDGGVGLWLRGDGTGDFTPASTRESGVEVFGEQRGCAVADYDGDGRTDLVVTQNSGPTKLYHNVRGRAGLRVRVRGPAGNPTGVGTVLRLVTEGRAGPAREIQGGAGYWSQNSAVTVLSAPATGARLQVRWPGGKAQTLDLPAAVREIEISLEGGLKVVR